ncbi:ATP-binding cassette domain-containing protein [Streptomyces sp. SID5474]|nr:ATP-binding cassette domain-containing protein [Streptomyces sp. SID5474]
MDVSPGTAATARGRRPAPLGVCPPAGDRCRHGGEAARIDVAEPLVREAQSEQPLIDIRDLRKEFRIGKRTVTALDGVSLLVNQGESVAIVGESGSGKTTLARTLLGLERCTSGDISIDGVPAHDWSRLSAADRRRLRGTVQMVFQDPYASLNPMRSIGSTLSEAIRSHDSGIKDTAGAVADLLKTVGLSPAYTQRKPSALSGGERQRVAIARALAARLPRSARQRCSGRPCGQVSAGG